MTRCTDDTELEIIAAALDAVEDLRKALNRLNPMPPGQQRPVLRYLAERLVGEDDTIANVEKALIQLGISESGRIMVTT